MTAKAVYNWELTDFNLPKTINGTAIIRCSTNYNGDAAETAYLLFDLIKDSNGTLSVVGNVSSEVFTSGGAAIIKNNVMNVALTQTHFKKGDILKLSGSAWQTQGTFTIAHDPANRDGTAVTPASTYPTKMEVFIPFRIDL